MISGRRQPSYRGDIGLADVPAERHRFQAAFFEQSFKAFLIEQVQMPWRPQVAPVLARAARLEMTAAGCLQHDAAARSQQGGGGAEKFDRVDDVLDDLAGNDDIEARIRETYVTASLVHLTLIAAGNDNA